MTVHKKIKIVDFTFVAYLLVACIFVLVCNSNKYEGNYLVGSYFRDNIEFGAFEN